MENNLTNEYYDEITSAVAKAIFENKNEVSDNELSGIQLALAMAEMKSILTEDNTSKKR